jgi:hypothetical protein
LPNQRRVQFDLRDSDVADEHVDLRMKEELSTIMEAKHVGVAYCVHHGALVHQGKEELRCVILPST